jgi:hypothetical protein
MLIYNNPGHSAALIGEDEGSICVFLWTASSDDSSSRLELLLAPSPMNADVLKRCVERTNDHNGDQSARILRVYARDADAISAIPELQLKQRHPQYMFSPASFADIGGRKYRSMRRNVSKVEALANVEARPYTGADNEACLNLLSKWRHHHRDTHGTMGGIGTSKRLINLAGEFAGPDIYGEAILCTVGCRRKRREHVPRHAILPPFCCKHLGLARQIFWNIN